MTELGKATSKLDHLKADYQIRLDGLKAKLTASPYEGQKAEIEREIEQLNVVYTGAFKRAEVDRKAAEDTERTHLANQEAMRDAKELEVKANALIEWERVGGDPKQFEASWPDIRQAVLNERVIKSLINRDQDNQAKTKPIAL